MKQVRKYFIVKIEETLGERSFEYVDCFGTMEEAAKALFEYRLAFGTKAKLDILIKTESYNLKGDL